MAFATRSALHAARRAAVATTRPVAARGAASCASSAWDYEAPVLSEPFDRRVGASSRTEPLIVSSAEEALGHVLTDSCKVFLHTGM
ncbi:hypothetical protein EON67_06360 [archaeon]|nr:MAG: hypothetical protein EON67_06360 [archaeon]